MGSYPPPSDPGVITVPGVHRGRIDAIPSGSVINAGDHGWQYGYDYERRATTANFNGLFDPTKWIRRSLPYHPRSIAGMAPEIITGWGSGGRGIPLAQRPYIFKRPIPTGNTKRTIVLAAGDTAQKTFRFNTETDVTFVLPTAAPWPNDLQVRDARSVTVVGGKLTAVGGATNRGGSVDIKGLVHFAWFEGVTLDQTGRNFDHDGFNISGKPRTGSTQGHAPGDVAHYGDVTRATYPLVFRINVCVLGVKGHEDTTGDHVHGDVNQLQGPVGGIFVDGEYFTASYQGYQFMTAQGVQGRIVLNRIDGRGYDDAGGATPYSRGIFYWFPTGGNGDENPATILNQVFSGPAVWPLDDPVVSRRGQKKDINDTVFPNGAYVLDPNSEGQDVGMVDPASIMKSDGVTPYSAYVWWAIDGTFVTGSASTDTLQVRVNDATGLAWTNVAHTYADGDQITLSGDDAAGHGFDSETPLYVVNGNQGAGTLQIATTPGGTPINITSDIVTGDIVVINRARKYVMANPYMNMQGMIIEGLATDVPYVRDGIESGIGYVSPGSVWDVGNSLIQTKGDILGGTAAGMMARLAAAASDGMELVSDSTQATGLAWKQRSRALATVNASPVTAAQLMASNTTADTLMASIPVPTSIAAGDILRVEYFGTLFNNSGSSVNFTFTVKLGGVQILQSPAIAEATAANYRSWMLAVLLNVVDPAASEILSVFLDVGVGSTNPWANSSGASHGPGTAAAAIDLRPGVNLDLSVAMGTAPGNTEVRFWHALPTVLKK